MYLKHLELLACPDCHESLSCTQGKTGSGELLIDGTLACSGCRKEYPVRLGVPRFVPSENYASGFGLEWTKHARTQYDSYTGMPISEKRFFGQTHWPHDTTPLQ